MGNIRIVALMDNQNGERKDLTAEHGLSLYIETGYTSILFDFGQGKHTYENAVRLNIRPERIDYGVCSHGHYDHGGGYREFVKNGLSCPLATGKGFFSEKYSLGKTKAACLGTGFDAAFLKENKSATWYVTVCCPWHRAAGPWAASAGSAPLRQSQNGSCCGSRVHGYRIISRTRYALFWKKMGN